MKKGLLKTDVKLLYQATEAQLSSSLSASRPWNDIANQRAEFERYSVPFGSVPYGYRHLKETTLIERLKTAADVFSRRLQPASSAGVWEGE